ERPPYRILTHHGRTDELQEKRTRIAGQREHRFLYELHDAEKLYDFILETKLADEKGYRLVDLESKSPLIGSSTLCENSGENRKKEEEEEGKRRNETDSSSSLPPQVAKLVRTLYANASKSISDTVIAKITTRG